MLAGCLLLTLAAGCQSVGPDPTSYCLIAKPIYVSSRDVLTDGTVVEILRHNETYAKLCK
jgi:hypothetical protein